MRRSTVVLLLSDKRSGSTMFGRELCRHPDVQTVAYSPHRYLESHHWLKAAVMSRMAGEAFGGQGVYGGYGTRANARAYMIDQIMGNLPDFAVPESDHDLIFEGWEALCTRFAQPVFFEKSPQLLGQWAALSLLLTWMARTSFRVKLIGLTRNPIAVQYSAFELFHTDPEHRQFGWLEAQKNLHVMRSMIAPEDFYHVRYEDIVNNPITSFGDLCDFIGIARTPLVGGSVHTDSLTKWLDDPHFTLQLDPTVRQMAQSWGYEEAELSNLGKAPLPFLNRVGRRWRGHYKLGRARLRDRLLKPLWLRVRQLARANERF